MLSRLFKLNGQAWPSALGLAALNSLLSITGCGSSFSAASANSAGAPGLGGSAGETSSLGGESGSQEEAGTSGSPTVGMGGTSSGGAAGSSSVAGSAGKASTSCDCTAGTYCQDGTTKCVSCNNFNRLMFAPPQKLTSLAQSDVNERFPRPANSGSALFYAAGDVGQEHLWYAPTPVSGIGTTLSEAARVESGPLLAPGFATQNFFFDRLQTATGKRKIMTANWTGAAIAAGSPALAPTPINVAGFDDYSIAVAPGAGRAYWMSTRSGEPLMYWEALSAPAATLELKVGPHGCPRTGADATPWVDLAGTVLLFRSQSVNDNCELNDSGAYDLFAVPLDKNGVAATNAVALSSLNNTGGMSNETDPSLSQDACFIYFATDNGTGNYDLYRAARN